MSDPWADFRVKEPSAPVQGGGDPWAEFRGAPAPPVQADSPFGAIRAPAPHYSETLASNRAALEAANPAWSATKAQAADVAKSAGVGLGKGVLGVLAAPRDLSDAAGYGLSWLAAKGAEKLGLLPQGRTADELIADLTAAGNVGKPDPVAWPRSADMQRAVEGVTGDFYKPKTTAGAYAERVAEFAPGALMGGGSAAGNLARFAAAPAVASETAGRLAEGSGYEGWARAAGALAGGVGGALAGRASAAERAVSRAAQGLPAAEREAILNRAEALFQDAQRMGVPMTRATAVQAASNGATNLGNLQRVLEGQGALRGYFAPTEAGVAGAAGRAFDAIAPGSATPSMIGPQAADAAQGVIRDVQGAINRTTRPLYQAAERESVSPQAAAALANDPLYRRAAAQVTKDPALNRTVSGMAPDSVGMVDLAQRRLGEMADAARAPGQATTSNLRAANYADARSAALEAADAASPAYALARETQRQLRAQYLDPLVNGPLGKLADAPDTKRAIRALFPENPVAGGAGEVREAVQALAQRQPMVARQLVRAHLEGAFNEAAQRVAGGANEWGGASFAAAVRGNPEQAASLAAAVKALPKGEEVLRGLDRFLDVMAATGQRQRVGSQTAFNAEAIAGLKGGGAANEAAKVAASGGLNLPKVIASRFEEWNLGRNADAIARLLTDPGSAQLFRHLAKATPGGSGEWLILGRLASLGFKGYSTGKGAANEAP